MTATGGDDPSRAPGPAGGPDRPAGSIATRVVGIATLLLPRGLSRDRYRHEFAAELYGQPPARQIAYALAVCGHIWSLRAVVVHGSAISRTPFSCRLNLLHRWDRRTSDEGFAFRTCSRCGREKGDLAGTSINSLFLPMGAGRPED